MTEYTDCNVTPIENSVAHNIDERKRTNDVLVADAIDFPALLLSENVLQGLKSSGFERPSPIQLKAIPLGRCGLDLIVQAKSGTGKTCVFSVISLESLQTESFALQILVLAPTREIAIQIWEVIRSIGKAVPDLSCHTFIGGMPLHEDKQKLKKCHIAVGTPGRIKQLIENGVMFTGSIRMFILDEADKLLEESFQEQINWIYSSLPDNKQMLALSATYPEYLAQHLIAYMRNPTFLRLNISDPALLGIKQYYRVVPHHPLPNKLFENKTKLIVEILSSINFQQCLVFSNLQTRAQNIAEALTELGWPTACIAGSYDQKDRNEAMSKLKTYKCRVLISTDLTSRGIDANRVDMVINLDIPKDHETYLHRIGRAGRFGTFGAAVSVVSEGQELKDLRSVERKCNTNIQLLPDPIPANLPKSECKLTLDDVVSSKQIITSPDNRKKFFQRKFKKDKETKGEKSKKERKRIQKVEATGDDHDAEESDMKSPEQNGKLEKTLETVSVEEKEYLLTDNDDMGSGDHKIVKPVEKGGDKIPGELLVDRFSSLDISCKNVAGGCAQEEGVSLEITTSKFSGETADSPKSLPQSRPSEKEKSVKQQHRSETETIIKSMERDLCRSDSLGIKALSVNQIEKAQLPSFEDTIDYKRLQSPHSYESARKEYMVYKSGVENQQKVTNSLSFSCPNLNRKGSYNENVLEQVANILKQSTFARVQNKFQIDAQLQDKIYAGHDEMQDGRCQGTLKDDRSTQASENVESCIRGDINLTKTYKPATKKSVYNNPEMETCVTHYNEDDLGVEKRKRDSKGTDLEGEKQLEQYMAEFVLGIQSYTNSNKQKDESHSETVDSDEDSSTYSFSLDEYSSSQNSWEEDEVENYEDYANENNFVYEVYDEYADDEEYEDDEEVLDNEDENAQNQWDSSGYATLHNDWNHWGNSNIAALHYPYNPWPFYPNMPYPWITPGYSASHYGLYGIPMGYIGAPYGYPAYHERQLQQTHSMQRCLQSAMDNQQKYIKYMMKKS